MNVTVAGVGSHIPSIVVSNERIARAIPGWSAERIAEKTGILERRFLWDFDDATGKTHVPAVIEEPGPTAQVAEPALRQALASARMDASELDGLIVTGCTPDMVNFSHDALVLHQRIGMRPEAFALSHDDGCGGAQFHLSMAYEMLQSGKRKSIAVLGVNVFSPHLDRDVYSRTLKHRGKELGSFLSFYLFGDGAGAIILRASPEKRDSGFQGSYLANERQDLVIRRSGGNLWPAHPGRTEYTDPAFYVDGQLVASAFAPLLRKAIDGALTRANLSLRDIRRFYLHQANKRVLDAFIADAGIPADRVAMHMQRYGNIVTAGTLVLLAEDVRDGVVQLGSGEPVLMAAIGAGAQCAANVIRL